MEIEKQFNLTFGHTGKPSGYNPISEREAYDSAPDFSDEMALRELDPGESHTDRDGDTWERIA